MGTQKRRFRICDGLCTVHGLSIVMATERALNESTMKGEREPERALVEERTYVSKQKVVL